MSANWWEAAPLEKPAATAANDEWWTAAPLEGAPAPYPGPRGFPQRSNGVTTGPRRPANIDLTNRPRVRNPDGSISTVRSKSFGFPEGEVLLPTVSDTGTNWTDEEAIENYRKTHKHLGIYSTIQEANAAAERIHLEQAAQLDADTPASRMSDPFGTYYAQNRDRAPQLERYEVNPLESLWDSLSSAPSAPSFSDWFDSMGATLARQMQGYELGEYEDLESQLLGRTFPANNYGMPKYSRTPEELRNVQDDPMMIAVREGIDRIRAAGLEITADQQAIMERNPEFWSQALMTGTNSFVASLPSMVATIMTKKPVVGAGVAGLGTSATAYGEMRELGVPIGKAELAANTEGLIETLTEVPSLGAAFRQSSPIKQRIAETLLAEVPGETVATIGQDVTRSLATASPDTEFLNALSKGLEQGLSDLPMTYATVGGTSMAEAGIGHMADMAREKREEIKADAQFRDLSEALAQQQAIDAMRPPQPFATMDPRDAQPFGLRQPDPQDAEAFNAQRQAEEAAKAQKAQAEAKAEAERTGKPVAPPDPVSALPPMTAKGQQLTLEEMRALFDVASLPDETDTQAPELPLPDPNIQPELPLDTIGAPPISGSPAPEPGGAKAPTAPTAPPAQGTATPSPPAQAVPPAPPASKKPASAPAPAAPAVSTTPEPPAGGTAPQVVQSRSTAHLTASVPAALAALKDPTQHATIETKGGPVRLVNVGDDVTSDRVIHAFDDKNKVIGSMYYSTEAGRDQPHVSVDPSRQRQGIASAMYDLAEKTGGIIPPASAEGQARLPEGQAFREGRERKATPVANFEVHKLVRDRKLESKKLQRAYDAATNRIIAVDEEYKRLRSVLRPTDSAEHTRAVDEAFTEWKKASDAGTDQIVPASENLADKIEAATKAMQAIEAAQPAAPSDMQEETAAEFEHAANAIQKENPEAAAHLRAKAAEIRKGAREKRKAEFKEASPAATAAPAVAAPAAEKPAKAKPKAAAPPQSPAQTQLFGDEGKPTAEAEQPVAPPAKKVKPYKLPEPPPIKQKGAKRSSKVQAQFDKMKAEFQERWAEFKGLMSQWKADDLPAAIAEQNSKIGLGLQYLKQADTFRNYTGELTRLNRWLEEAADAIRQYEPPEQPAARSAQEEERAKTLDNLVADQSRLTLRDGMSDALGGVKNAQTVARSFFKNTFPKLNARAKEYALGLAGHSSGRGRSEAEIGKGIADSLSKDAHHYSASDTKLVSFMAFADEFMRGKRELPPPRVHDRKKTKDNEYQPLVPKGTPVRDTAPVEPLEGEIVPLPTTEEKFGEVIDDYAGLFEDPDVKVHATDHPDYTGFISEKQARKRVLLWERQAEAQGRDRKKSRMNADKVIFSLFDLTQAWSQPYIDAGYTVIPLDIQTGTDILDFSVAYLHENYPEISDVHGILIAAPCTDFTRAGNAHFAAKDADGRTSLSQELVHQAMRLVDYYKPPMWVLENPAQSYVEDAAGLPKARYEFQPYDFGDPYMKRTQLWGNFNTDLPVAPVYPREGSKMWSEYGGKSQATKNARSETPRGFAAAFFKANNVADASPQERLLAEFPDAAGAIEKSLEAGFSEDQIRETIEGIYESDDAKEARAALRKMVKTETPAGEPQTLPKPEKRTQTKRAKFTNEAEREIQAKLKAERDERLGRGNKQAETEEDTDEETGDEEVVTQDEDVGALAASGIEASATEPSSRKREGEKIIPPSTTRENLMNELGLDPTEFRLKGGKEQFAIVAQALKDKYGFANIVKSAKQDWRNSTDHLLDAFESLQNLAAAMGQGEKIVSLNGVISLLMKGKPGKVSGYFRHRGGLSGEPNFNIAVFNQEDVYSHEFAHALDYDLMEKVGGFEPGGLSRMIRNREATAKLPGTLQEAFADLMTAIYYDAADIALLIKKVQHQLQNSKSPKRQAELQKRLDNLKSGAWRGRGSKTQFYLRAKNGPMEEYLTKPTELIARSFEAYISWKIQTQQALGLVKFVGATDKVYSNTADAWINRIYPQAVDRQNIFSAWDNLLGQLARQNLYNTKGNPGFANSQVNLGLMDPVAQAKATGTPLTPDIIAAKNLTNKAAQTYLEDEARRRDTFWKNMKQLGADLKEGTPGNIDSLRAAMKQVTSTPDGIFAFLERKFPHIASLRTIRDNLSDAQIHGRNKPAGIYRETQRQEASITNRLEDRLGAVGVTRNMDKKWTSEMWDVLHGYRPPADAAEKRQADQIRYELDYLWKLRDQTGAPIGYVDEPYVPRVFMRDIADDPRFHKALEQLRIQEKIDLLAKLNNQLAAAKTQEAQDILKAKIKTAQKIDPVAATTAQVAAMKGLKWGEPVYLGALSEDSAKERVFGPLADKILKDFYIKDPFTLLSGYGAAAARGMVQTRRLGLTPDAVYDKWLAEAARDLPAVYGEILKDAMQRSLGMRTGSGGPLVRGVNSVSTVVTTSMLGRSVLPNLSEPLGVLAKSNNPMKTLGDLMKAIVPLMASQSQRERFAAADRFGRLSGVLVDAASATTAMAQHLGEDTQGNGILARFSMRAYYFNLLSSLTAVQEKITNRVAFEAFYEAARIIRKGGKEAGLYRQWLREHGITDADAFGAFLKDKDDVDKITFEDTLDGFGRQLANATEHFGKTTINKPTPSTKHIQAHNGLIGPMLRLTSWMTTNFTNWAVQLKDKAMTGITGKYGADVVSIGDRIRGTHRGKQLTKAERLHGRVGGTDLSARQRVTAMMFPTAMALGTMYVAQAAFLIARMWATHPEEWEDRGDDFWERFFNRKTQLQIAQYWGVLGWLMNTVIDAVEGTRFNRGVFGSLAGPSYGGMAQDAERLVTLAVNNKPGNTAENNAAQATYHIASILATVGLVNTLPATSTPARVVGFVWSFFGTSPLAQHTVADWLTGEKETALRKKAKAGDQEAKQELKERAKEKGKGPKTVRDKVNERLEKGKKP